MKRLLEYMRPYKWRVIFALGAGGGGYAAGIGAASTFREGHRQISGARCWTSRQSCMTRGMALVLISVAIWLLVIAFDFLAQYIQIRIMQRVGQQTMYDMRTEIFGQLQRLPMILFRP